MNYLLGRSGALYIAIRQFVLQGFPTTITFTSLEELSLIALPYSIKIFPLSLIKSPLSIPGPLGFEPIRRA